MKEEYTVYTTRQRVTYRAVPPIQVSNDFWMAVMPGSPYMLGTSEHISWEKQPGGLSCRCDHYCSGSVSGRDIVVPHSTREYKLDGNVVTTPYLLQPNVAALPVVDKIDNTQYPVREAEALNVVLAAGSSPEFNIPLALIEFAEARSLLTYLREGAFASSACASSVGMTVSELCSQIRNGVEVLDSNGRPLRYTKRFVEPTLDMCSKGTLRRGANGVVCYQYGIQPLFTETSALVEAIRRAKLVCKRDIMPSKKVRGQVSIPAERFLPAMSDKTVDRLPSAVRGFGNPMLNTRDFVGSSDYGMPMKRYRVKTHRAIVYGEVVDSPFQTEGDRVLWEYRCGASPLFTAWAKIPLSFVLDWFLNIGRYLRALDTRAMALELSTQFKEGVWVAHREDTEEVVPIWSYSHSELEVLDLNPDECNYSDKLHFKSHGYVPVAREREFHRKPIVTYLPTFGPSLGQALGSAKLGSIAALIAQRIR